MSWDPIIIKMTAFSIGVVISSASIIFSRKNEVSLARADSYRVLLGRLNAYAQMKKPDAEHYQPSGSNLDFVPSGMILSHTQHDILLGALKKIEAKSAVLVVIAVFAFPLLITNIKIIGQLNGQAVYPVFFGLGCLLSILASGADGAGHLGQPHFRKNIVETCAEPIWGRELQRSLLEDMLQKEAQFSMSYPLLLLVIVSVGVAYISLNFF